MRSPTRSAAISAAPNELSLEALLGGSVRTHPFLFDPDLPVDVRLVRWPTEHAYRDELAALGVARILILSEFDAPPSPWDELEDWVRCPVDRDDLRVRATTLARRADLAETPWLDDDGLLWFRDRWCVVPPGQVPMIELFARHFGTVVRDEQVNDVYRVSGSSAHAEAVKTSMRRIANSLAPLGLLLRRVRGAGYLLERAP